MSTRFYAGLINCGMSRCSEDWLEPEPEPEPDIDAELRRWRASRLNSHGSRPARMAPKPDHRHTLFGPKLPSR